MDIKISEHLYTSITKYAIANYALFVLQCVTVKWYNIQHLDTIYINEYAIIMSHIHEAVNCMNRTNWINICTITIKWYNN
jgi:hypothetical protein